MIEQVKIQNFKSIVDLTVDLGRVNIIIGANGCGKTNILEAITFASAANQNKLENEFLGARLRNPKPEFMFSGFDDIERDDSIKISIKENGEDRNLKIINEKGSWFNLILKVQSINDNGIELIVNNKNSHNLLEYDIESIFNESFITFLSNFSDNSLTLLNRFLIYAPEETKLRTFSDDTQILPLGRRGEGLFQHLKELASQQEEGLFESINEGLSMLDWFDGFNLPKDLLSNEYRLTIGDRFLNESVRYFDQRSTNEGFLYLLFYLTLFNSKQTPQFFSVDNIETSFNPKLCTKLIEHLIELTKKNDKQVIITTHSPYVLDGLDLSDAEQRLFVARRDIEGHTRIERIPYRENREMLLSDLWMSGLIGGLPDNF